MDYSVGSVADIISGSNTPNKPKVIKKQFKLTPKPTAGSDEDGADTVKKFKKKSSMSPKGKRKAFKQTRAEDDDTDEPPSFQAEQDPGEIKNFKKKRSASPQGKKIKILNQIKIEADDTDESPFIQAEQVTGKTNLKKKRSISPKFKRNSPIKEIKVEADDTDENEVTVQNGNATKKFKKNRKQRVEDSSVNEEETQIKTESGDDSEEELGKTKKKNPDHTTIFVGNLPITITHQKLQKMFSKQGKVVNARIRSIPVADPKIPKRIAAIKKTFHPERKSVHGYVTFATPKDAQKALALNGHEYKEHHIRVNLCDQKQAPDKDRCIFLGNVSFAAEEEELWKLFQACGEIESVRLVRDRFTDIGKGFGYINFKSADSVELALQMGEITLRDRVLRISLYNGKAPKKAKMEKKKQGNLKAKKKEDGPGQKGDRKLVTTATHGQFQGRFATEKKKKFNKGNQQKKKMAKKIAPKTISG